MDRWQDLSLLVQGPVIDHITDIFRSDWKFASKEALGHHSTTRQALKSDSRRRDPIGCKRTGCSQRFTSQCDPDRNFQGQPTHLGCDTVFCAR